MGKLTNLNPSTPLTDSDIPAGIARDTEVLALGIQNPASGTYGSISVRGVQGEKNNFAGIHFPDAFDGPTLMIDTLARLNGIWSPNSGWHWNYNKGRLRIYNSEPIAPANQRGTYFSMDKSTGSHPSFPLFDWPVLKTDATTLFFGVGGQISASISPNGTYTAVSDKNRKENALEVDYAAILRQLRSLPIYRYTFKGESTKIKRCGCYAQDFYKEFGLGGKKTATRIPPRQLLYPTKSAS